MRLQTLFLLLIAFNTLTEAQESINWISKLGFQYFETKTSSDKSSLKGPLVAFERLLGRKKQSFFSSVFEASKGTSKYRVDTQEREAVINHYGLGLKWNFGPTDYDYPLAVDYAYTLNQGSIYLKACLTYTKPNNDAIYDMPVNLDTNKFSSQYGLGYEVSGENLGLFAEYSYSFSEYIDSGLLRGGMNWRF